MKKRNKFFVVLLAGLLFVPCISLILSGCGSPNTDDFNFVDYYFNDEGAVEKADYTEEFWGKFNFSERPSHLVLYTTDAEANMPTPEDVIGPKFLNAEGELITKRFGGWFFDKKCTPTKLLTKESWSKLTKEDKEHGIDLYAKWLEPNEISIVTHARDLSKYYQDEINASFKKEYLQQHNNIETPYFIFNKDTIAQDLLKLPNKDHLNFNREYQFDGWYLDLGIYTHDEKYKLTDKEILTQYEKGISHFEVYPKYSLIPKVWFKMYADLGWRDHLKTGIDGMGKFSIYFDKSFSNQDLANNIYEELLITDENATGENLMIKLPELNKNIIEPTIFIEFDYYKIKAEMVGWYFFDEVKGEDGELHLKPQEELVKVTASEMQKRIDDTTFPLTRNVEVGILWNFTKIEK